jgi:hypothetical protein
MLCLAYGMYTEQSNFLAPCSSTGLEQLRRFNDATNDRDIDIATATSFYRQDFPSSESGMRKSRAICRARLLGSRKMTYKYGLDRRFNLTPQGNADAAWHFRFSCNRTQPVLSGVMHVQPLSVSVKMAVSWLVFTFTTPSASYSSDFCFLDCQTYVFGQNLRKTYVNVKH